VTKRILFLAHRRELILQASDKLYALGIDHGIIMPGYPSRPDEPVQVASVQTLYARAVRTAKMDLPAADVVVVDEAHHCRARTNTKIIERYSDAIILGMTATPCRGDGLGLGRAFDVMIQCPQVHDLIDAGYLVPTRVYAPSLPDVKGIRVERGDYVESQLAERMNTDRLVGDIIEHWLRLGQRRKTVVFATGVAHSKHVRDEFRRAGVLAEHIDGDTPVEERDRVLRQLAKGEIEVVTNAMVLTEGWDSPAVSCLVLARPTESLGLYRQMLGRVLRPAPGKTDALILDHAGATFAHGFVEDPIEWSLSEDTRAVNKAHAARGSGQAPGALTNCPECAAVMLRGKPCGACGWRPQRKAEAVEVLDGELAHLQRNGVLQAKLRSDAEKAKFHRELLWIAQERERKAVQVGRTFKSAGWVAHKYKDKFGHWPPRSPQPQPEMPSAAVRAWVRSRDIAYARAMASRGGGR
jgi:superfamily II DNA or RNA helicase